MIRYALASALCLASLGVAQAQPTSMSGSASTGTGSGGTTGAQISASDTVQTSREVEPPPLSAGRLKDLQTKLDQQGFSPGTIDGLWGPNTSAALRRFQAAKKLQATGEFDQQTLASLGAADVTTSLPAAPVTPRIAATPEKGESAAANPAPNTASSGARTTASRAGMDAAGGNDNQAIATTDANAPQPAHGANSFSKGEAERRITGQGFQDVSDLHKDETGVWRGAATKGGQHVQVWLDYKGNVGQLSQPKG